MKLQKYYVIVCLFFIASCPSSRANGEHRTFGINCNVVMITDSRVMKFPDKFIFLSIDYKKRRENKHYNSYDMSKATDNNSNDFLQA